LLGDVVIVVFIKVDFQVDIPTLGRGAR
jgi:hypothetical protein